MSEKHRSRGLWLGTPGASPFGCASTTAASGGGAAGTALAGTQLLGRQGGPAAAVAGSPRPMIILLLLHGLLLIDNGVRGGSVNGGLLPL